MDFPRISKTEFAILGLLRDGQERFGLEMVNESDGRIKRGTIYVTLGRMGEKGLVDSRQEERPSQPGLPRRMYKISAAGSRAFDALELVASGGFGTRGNLSYG
ncbi:PadR family transcriptional regulator [Citromicrobium bathyomarinum]|uniref:PadR family transcriptional regulator n=1 Tax=Citromicrobium bathyomarinum TaxID=72174 RepID=UPI003CC91377